MNIKLSFVIAAFIITTSVIAQNTVGLLSYDPAKAFDGYNIHYPHNQSTVFLLNNCGEIVHKWEDSSNFRPANTAYLMKDGNLIKAKRDAAITGDAIWAGGGGETIEIRDWDNQLLWTYSLNDSTGRLHHDIAPMPNGNILAIAWEHKSKAEAIQAGRDTTNLPDDELWPERVIEIEPDLTNSNNDFEIVWEWSVWDHLIQDFDSTKDNFGVVSEHPELININFDTHDGDADWLHANSIDYNPTLDQIMLSIPYFNEIWIIDHSTSTNQATSNSGGLSGKGGDLMFRWGNPIAFNKGTASDQKLFFQHDAHWMDVALSNGHPDKDKIMVFNNRVNDTYSSVNIISPIFIDYEWQYDTVSGGTFSPSNFEWTYTTDPPEKMFSTGLSGAQRLENGNTLICDGRSGYTFEITPIEEVVWEYENPMISGSPVSQGDSIAANANLNFRFYRYPTSYEAFSGKNLESLGYIENNPDTTFCNNILSVNSITSDNVFEVYPNPTVGNLAVKSSKNKINNIHVYDVLGNQVFSNTYNELTTVQLNDLKFKTGIYLLKINNTLSQQILFIEK